MNLLSVFDEAFRARSRPSIVIASSQLDAAEYAEAMSLSGKNWSEITCAFLEKNFEVLNWLTPKAFCYYLPGVCCAGVREHRANLLSYDSIVGMLDRSPLPHHWDRFFVERWTLLSRAECDAVEQWLLWLSSEGEAFFHGNTLSRALDTMELLKSGLTTFR